MNSDGGRDELIVRILPGIPGAPIEADPTGEISYPSTTTDIVKVLRESGVTVEYAVPREDRQLVSQKSAAIFVPILAVTYGAVGSLLAAAIVKLFGSERAERSELHVRVERGSGKNKRVFEGNGPGRDVLEALRRFDDAD